VLTEISGSGPSVEASGSAPNSCRTRSTLVARRLSYSPTRHTMERSGSSAASPSIARSCASEGASAVRASTAASRARCELACFCAVLPPPPPPPSLLFVLLPPASPATAGIFTGAEAAGGGAAAAGAAGAAAASSSGTSLPLIIFMEGLALPLQRQRRHVETVHGRTPVLRADAGLSVISCGGSRRFRTRTVIGHLAAARAPPAVRRRMYGPWAQGGQDPRGLSAVMLVASAGNHHRGQ
jgi:hypothetical protein